MLEFDQDANDLETCGEITDEFEAEYLAICDERGLDR